MAWHQKEESGNGAVTAKQNTKICRRLQRL
jgi:hypothetical protein